ncbi:MAG: 5'-methylthioadenosine/adenosylhomocysteine nucleosidase [Phycisphaerales bacterium]|nr:MAG: 5'-methylthioadenosine/adenosylhomocysteine nucleosidase [Phycisphaerales bacterium]
MNHRKLVALICVPTILLSCSCRSVGDGAGPEPVTAVLGAFDKEVTLLEDQLVDSRERMIEDIRFVTGRLNGRKVVIVWTGIGKVNAAMTTTLLIEHFKPSEVIFTGIAGGVNPELGPGDIVIAKMTAHHDMGTLWPDALYYKGVKNRLSGWENPVFFEAEESLLKAAEQAGEEIKLEPFNTITGKRVPKVVKGVVVTGDVFVASAKKSDELRERLGADAVEMEGAAVAQLCYQREIPCLVIRSLSDKADESAMQDKQMFYIMAVRNSASLVGRIVGRLGSAQPVEESVSEGVGTDQGL